MTSLHMKSLKLKKTHNTLDKIHENMIEEINMGEDITIPKLKKEYDSCICGKKLSSNICKTGLYQYDSHLLAEANDKNYINLDKFDNAYKLINYKFPYSI